MPMNLKVLHNPALFRFEINVEGLTAIAEYEDRGDFLAITHTFVPEPLRGRGLAAMLVNAALEYARANGKKVDPVCSYAARFMEQHPEFADLALAR